MPEIVTAAMLVIGDEILSGRTKDRNIGHLADIMTAIGIDLKEVRIVPDEEDEIVGECRARPLQLCLHYGRHRPDA
jgi:molybdopterin-biosynthesis enzyme MoeA-like protein